ncbi:MAG: biopolymer transporter ExbD [Planctomycetes bacterium]|nr:biopolymer transporter ExbD [Planctomycetota bacterium]
MRFQRNLDDDGGAQLPIAPMVDTVFSLLAFFVLGTQVALPERDFAMGYREVALARGAEAQDFPAAILVQLRATPEGVAITIGQARMPNDHFDGIRAKLAEINMPGLDVIIQADPALTVDQVARALDAALASPMKKISVSRLTVAAAPRKPDSRPGDRHVSAEP